MPDSVIGQLAGKAFIIKPNGAIVVAAKDSVMHEGDVLISSLFGHSNKDQKAVVVDLHQGRVLLNEQTSLIELMIPENLDVSDIVTAIEEGKDPTQLEGVEAAAGNAADSSSIAAHANIESGNTSHRFAFAGFATNNPTDFGLTPQQQDAIGRVFNAQTEDPIASLTGDSKVEEGSSASYTLSISNAVDTDTRVNVFINHKTSESGDITPVTREVIIPAGQTSVTFSVETIDDVFDEASDSDAFTVSISGIQTGDADQNIAIPPPIETNILDEEALNRAERNDAPILTLSGSEGDANAPTLALTGDSSVNEGESANYTVTLSEPPSTDMTVTVTIGQKTTENSAVSPVTRNILIPTGSVSASFEVDTVNDIYDESSDGDVFSVSVNAVSGGGFEQNPALPPSFETTLNDGTANAPSLTLAGDSNITEGDSASYTVTLSHAPSSDFAVTVVVGQRSSEDGDVTPERRDIIINAGTTSTTFTVTTANDVFDESNDLDTFNVTVSNTSGGGFEAQPTLPPSIETTINDDDFLPLIEDVGSRSVSGVLQVLDGSGDELTFANTTVVGEYGSLTLVDGEWTYTLYQNAQMLNDGQEVNENITLTSTDGTPQVISIAVTGTQDAAVVTGNFTGSVDTDGFSINPDETNNVHANSEALTSPTSPAWTTTSTTVDGVSLTLVNETWTNTLDKAKSASIPDDESTQDIFTITTTDGTEQNIDIDVTGNQPAINLSLQGENTGNIIVDLSPQAASPGFIEDSASGDVAFTLDAYTADLVDDEDLTDSRETQIQITSLPTDGVLYYFNDNGAKIAVTLDQILPDDTAFVFEPERPSVTFAASDITSATQTTIVKDGITVSGGTFSGSKPDSSSTIRPANIVWEFQSGERGIGVGADRELTSPLNEVMVIEFTGNSDITSSNIVVSSAYGNFSDTHPANGQAHAIVYRDGQVVGEYDYPNLWEVSGGDGIATINIANPDGFDEIRFYVTATVNSNLNVTSISAEGVNTTETEFTYKAINSLNNESETATVTLGETIKDHVSVTTPSSASGSLSVVAASGLTAVFANTTEAGRYGEIVLVDGMWTYTVDPTRLDAIPDNQSVQDVITLTATDGTTTDVTIVIGESEGAITNYYTSLADDSLSDIINMNNTTYLGSANDDRVQGDDGEDVTVAKEGNDRIFGGDGNDTIDLGFGDDFVSGGGGNDILFGGGGEDVFTYFSGDEGIGSFPAIDHIGDFNTQEDTLNLTDLLQGETSDTVDQYLNIVDDSEGHAILNISKNGDGLVNQQVVFDNLSVNDMATAYQIDTTNMTADQISTSVIDAMLMQSKIVID